MSTSNPILNLTFTFAVQIVEYCEALGLAGKSVIQFNPIQIATV